MKNFYFQLEGKPFPKQRPRFVRATGRAYTPKETVAYEAMVAEEAAKQIPVPLEGAIVVYVMAEFQMPKSWSKKKKEAMNGKPHTQRPDLDNIQKAVLDGMNGVAFNDDSQVWSTIAQKVWAERNKTTVAVMEKLEDAQ